MRQKEKIVFTIDKTRVTEHEYITVRWECGMPDQVSLTVEDGTRQVFQLGDSGTKVIEASGNTDIIRLTLRASVKGNVYHKELSVKVRHRDAKSGKGHRSSRRQRERKPTSVISNIKNWWDEGIYRVRTTWSYLPENKKLALETIGLMCCVMLLAPISPKLVYWGIIAVITFLTWVIYRQ